MSENNKKRLNIRRSGLKANREDTRKNIEEELISSDDINKFSDDYDKLLHQHNRRRNLPGAYLIRFTHEPSAFFITFQTFQTRDTGKWEACKYFHSIGHPTIGLDCYSKARRKRIPQFDKYRDTGKIPIEEIMSLGASFRCGICGNHTFTYEDLKRKRCFIVRGEGEINPFTDGMVICNECRRKYFS